MEYAGVHLIDSPYFLDCEFDYYIPSEHRDIIAVGDFVSVPFGNANKKKLALVVSLKEKPDKPNTVCKPISELCPPPSGKNVVLSSIISNLSSYGSQLKTFAVKLLIYASM